MLNLSENECLLDSDISTSGLSDVTFDSEYTLLTDIENITDDTKLNQVFIESYIGSELLIEFYERYSIKKKAFDYKDALPSYAGHTI